MNTMHGRFERKSVIVARRVVAASMAGFVVATAALSSSNAWAQSEPPEAVVTRVSSDVLAAVKADPAIQAGDIGRVVALVNNVILPASDFERMTASATGPAWRTASAAQKTELQEQFKTLLIRVYAGALEQARDRTIELKPSRSAPTDPLVVVRSEVRGGRDPIELDFRLAREDAGWKVVDLNVGGVWLVENYRSSFAQEVNNGGVDGLIAALTAKNKAFAGR